MSGNSRLAISQWFTAAQRPEHLTAIAPWEGLSDCCREIATRGGVMMPEFVKMLSDSFASTENGGIEDVITMMNEQPTMNNWWADKEADLEAIDIPAYIVASYTNPIHTYALWRATAAFPQKRNGCGSIIPVNGMIITIRDTPRNCGNSLTAI